MRNCECTMKTLWKYVKFNIIRYGILVVGRAKPRARYLLSEGAGINKLSVEGASYDPSDKHEAAYSQVDQLYYMAHPLYADKTHIRLLHWSACTPAQGRVDAACGYPGRWLTWRIFGLLEPLTPRFLKRSCTLGTVIWMSRLSHPDGPPCGRRQFGCVYAFY